MQFLEVQWWMDANRIVNFLPVKCLHDNKRHNNDVWCTDNDNRSILFVCVDEQWIVYHLVLYLSNNRILFSWIKSMVSYKGQWEFYDADWFLCLDDTFSPFLRANFHIYIDNLTIHLGISWVVRVRVYSRQKQSSWQLALVCNYRWCWIEVQCRCR